MLHERVPYTVRQDGVQLVRTWSDEFMIRKIGAPDGSAPYSEAIDVESCPDRYYETDIPLGPEEQEEATLADALDALGQLGVDIDD